MEKKGSSNSAFRIILLATILVGGFLLIDSVREILQWFEGYKELPKGFRYSIFYAIQIGLCLIVGFIFMKVGGFKQTIWNALGLDTSVVKGLGWAFVFTLPMFLGYWIVCGINKELTPEDVVFWSIVSPFAEELFYRALLIGFMFRFLRIGFLPAALIVSIIFGLGHLSQANELMESIGVFGITLFGSLLFGWIYLEWKNNLWIVFGMHLLMNLYWNIFNIEASNALGGWAANIFRFATIGLAIFITIRHIRSGKSQLSGRWLKSRNFDKHGSTSSSSGST